MEKYFFGGTLMVPMQKNDSRYTFCWLGSIKNANISIDVIAFNTNTADDFQPMLETDLNMLMHVRRQDSRKIGQLKLNGQDTTKEIERMRNIKRQIKFINRTLSEMADSVYVKQPEQPMLDLVARQLGRRLTKADVIYLSWITGVEK